jgi:hypothetical protein
MCAKAYCKKNGKDGIVFDELNKLPRQYRILKNIFFCLKVPVTYPRLSEKVRSCQIDYVVIGPTGVFVIESKQWDEYAFKEMIPYQQADIADLIVYIKLNNHYTRRIPKYTIMLVPPNMPVIDYGYIHQVSVWDLTTFIVEKRELLSKSEIREITRIMLGRK